MTVYTFLSQWNDYPKVKVSILVLLFSYQDTGKAVNKFVSDGLRLKRRIKGNVLKYVYKNIVFANETLKKKKVKRR